MGGATGLRAGPYLPPLDRARVEAPAMVLTGPQTSGSAQPIGRQASGGGVVSPLGAVPPLPMVPLTPDLHCPDTWVLSFVSPVSDSSKTRPGRM